MAADPPDAAALPGGAINTVVRIGDTVRRPPPPSAPFVRRLLGYLERCGWEGAPRFLGTDGEGRDILSFVDGHVPWRPADRAAVRSPDALVAVARLVRAFHDLTAGTDLAAHEEVVCHNDLAPNNTVYRPDGGWRPVAFIDWDLAAPGRRIHDVAHVCWQYVDLGPGVTDVTGAARLVRAVADGYGLTDRAALVDTILWWQDRCWRGIAAGAAAGDPAMVRLSEDGALTSVRAACRWVDEHRDALEEALSG